MFRQLILIVAILLINLSLLSKDAPETYSIKGKLTEAEKAIYDNWIQSVITAFKSIGPGINLDFTPTIVIADKKNSWPYQYYFYDEIFFNTQPLKFNKDSIAFNPIKEITGLNNNEFAFKQIVANYLVTTILGKNIPYWFEKGLSSYLVTKSGTKNWAERNFSYLLFLDTEKRVNKTTEQILNFKYKFDNKDRYLQDAYSWALVNWLMQQKEYSDSPNLILALSNPENKKSFAEVKALNSKWISTLEVIYWEHLPQEVKISSECQTILDEEDLRGLFFTIKKKNPIISADNIAVMIGYTIHPQTLANIKTLVKDIRPVVRELAVKTLGIIPDRTSLALLIEASYADISETVRIESAKSIAKLNFQLAPKALLECMNLEDPVSVGQAAMSIAIVGDPAPAKNLIQKLGSIRPTTNSLSITTTHNYVSDYNVVDGVLEPVISTCIEGISSEVTILWVVELRANFMAALNKMPLNYQGKTEADWYKWYSAQ